MTRLLIISPGFHGYYAAIARAFAERGYDVDTFCYDVAASSLEKAWNKAAHELPNKLRGSGEHLSAERVSRRAAEAVRGSGADVVLVVRGDILSEEFWFEAAAGSRAVGVWMYDELRRTSFEADMVGRHARMATYSALDTAALRASGHDALHVPLGYDASTPMARTTMGTGVISFIGAPFAKRETVLRGLIAAGVPVHAWGRGWSDHPFDRLRTWRLTSRGVPAGRDVPGDVTHAVMRNSVATLNIHGDQDGFTMRTFEAAGVGAVQLIDRADVSEFYEPGREVLVFETLEELVELARRVTAYPAEFSGLREAAARRTADEHTLNHRAAALEELWA